MSARNARIATSSKPLSGTIPDRRRKWYPLALLAQQGNRSVEEIVYWIEHGKLRAAKTSDGWLVHRDELDKWRDLCKEPRPTFTHLRALLDAFPELREIREEMGSAIFAKPSYDKARHDAARAQWDAALERLGVVFEPSSDSSFGFGGSHIEVPDHSEPGFDPIDRSRFDTEKQQDDQ